MLTRQFTLRALFRSLTLLSLILGATYYVVEVRPREQIRTVRAIAQANGEVYYDYEFHSKTLLTRVKAQLADILGKDTIGVVRHVSLTGVEDHKELTSLLVQVSKLGSVESMFLQGSNIDEEGIEVISRMQGLTGLYMSGTRYRLPSLAGLRNLKRMECLSLRFRSGVNDIALAEIARMPQLRELELCYTDVSDAGLEELVQCKQLHWLDVSWTSTTFEGFAALVDAPSLRTIVVDPQQEAAARELLPHLNIVVQ